MDGIGTGKEEAARARGMQNKLGHAHRREHVSHTSSSLSFGSERRSISPCVDFVPDSLLAHHTETLCHVLLYP